MQNLNLIFTFRRDNFSSIQYLNNTACEDTIQIFNLKGCNSLIKQIVEEIDNRWSHISTIDKTYIVSNVELLQDIYFILLSEKYLALGAKNNINVPNYNGIDSIYNAEQYYNIIKKALVNMEWLLFYLTKRVALSQFVEKLSNDAFDNTGTFRDAWLQMCEAWGNYSPENFEIIMQIE